MTKAMFVTCLHPTLLKILRVGYLRNAGQRAKMEVALIERTGQREDRMNRRRSL